MRRIFRSNLSGLIKPICFFSDMKNMAKLEKIRVLIADDDGQTSRQLASYISNHGFECRLATNGSEARNLITNWKPKLVLADLMLPDGNAYTLLDYIKTEPLLRHHFIHLIVMSKHNSEFNVKQSFDRGAKDYLVKPFKMPDVLQRLVFHCRSSRNIKEIRKSEYQKIDEASLMLHLTDLVLRQAISKQSIADKLYALTQMVSLKVDGVRCSIIEALDQQSGIVVVSNDDKEASGIRLDLNRYPEVLNVVNTGSLIAIENLEQSLELRSIQKLLKNVMFNSMIVCPVQRKGQIFGVLSLRMPKEKETISDNEIRFIEIVGHVVSLLLDQEKSSDSSDFWKEAHVSKTIPFPSPQNLKK